MLNWRLWREGFLAVVKVGHPLTTGTKPLPIGASKYIAEGDAFKTQMQRFIKANTLQKTLGVPSYCIYMSTVVSKQFYDVARQRLGVLIQLPTD